MRIFFHTAGQPQGRALRRSGPVCCTWAEPSGIAEMSSGRAGLHVKRLCPEGRRPGRAEITAHAKARSREVPMRKGQFFPEPSGRVGGAARCKGPSGATAAVRQAGRGPGGAEGLGDGLWQGRFSGVRDSWKSCDVFLLQLSENCNRAATS